MTYLASDILGGVIKLLPDGKAWNKSIDSNLTKTVALFMYVFERVLGRADQLLYDTFPQQTVELLPEWEQTLGLPDTCLKLAQTISDRQNAVVAKFTDDGGESIDHIITLVSTLGYDITITEHKRYTAGMLVGDVLRSDFAPFHWTVHTASETVTYFDVGNTAGQRLSDWGNSELECIIRRLAPSHTFVDFYYSPPPPYVPSYIPGFVVYRG